jgi:hypothetical protein
MPGKPQKQVAMSADRWEPLQLQLIAFPTAPPVDVEQEWFRDITGDDPTESQKKKHERFDKGPYQDADLMVAADLSRVVVSVTPRVPILADVPTALLTLGKFDHAVYSFSDVANRLLSRKDFPSVTRLSFAGKVTQQTKTHETGYQTLGKYLSGVKLDPKSSDFVYRINRPRPFAGGIKNLTINRLSTWMVVKFQIQAQPTLSSGQTLASHVVQDNLFACLLELDVNTALEYKGELPRVKMVRLFRDLVELGREIAVRGDVP